MTKLDDETLEAALGQAVSEYICQGLSVEDGVCRVYLHKAPGAPDGWAVQITAKPSMIEAYFCSDGGACGTVRSDPADHVASQADYESWLLDPVTWAVSLWTLFSDFSTVKWRIAGEDLTMVAA